MAQRFRGEATYKVDAKGRVSIPAPYRRVIEAGDPDWSEGKAPNIVIVYGLDNQQFLECYTMEAADEIDHKIDGMKRGSPERKLMEKLFHGHAHPTSIDDTGRLVLPQKLREKIGLSGEAYFISAGQTFKIWKPETYAEVEAPKTEALIEDLPDDFDPMLLLEGETLVGGA